MSVLRLAAMAAVALLVSAAPEAEARDCAEVGRCGVPADHSLLQAAANIHSSQKLSRAGKGKVEDDRGAAEGTARDAQDLELEAEGSESAASDAQGGPAEEDFSQIVCPGLAISAKSFFWGGGAIPEEIKTLCDVFDNVLTKVRETATTQTRSIGTTMRKPMRTTIDEDDEFQEEDVNWDDDEDDEFQEDFSDEEALIAGCSLPGGWKPTKLLGRGGFGSVFFVESEEGTKAAMKIMVVKTNKDDITPAVMITDFVQEIAAQMRAAELGLSVPVTNYLYCRHPTKSKDLGTGFVVMPIIEGIELAAYINKQLDEKEATDHKCDAKFTAPAPSVHGWLSDAMYEKVKGGIKELNQNGLMTWDFHGGNAMVGSDGELTFIDFGKLVWCKKKEEEIVEWGLSRLGCAEEVEGKGVFDLGCVHRND